MNSPASHYFVPPTTLQLRQYLDRCQPRVRSRWWAWLPLFALGGLLVLTTATQDAVVMLLIWIVVMALIGSMALRARQIQQAQMRLVHARELVMLRHWVRALRLTWRVLPSLVTQPHLYSQAVVLIAHCLIHVKAYEPGILAYQHIVNRLHSRESESVQLRIHCAMAQLADGQLADADDALRRLRAYADVEVPSTISASLRLAQLYQQVRTNHWHEAVGQSLRLVHELRPLGIESAYGYALMALAYHQSKDGDPRVYGRRAAFWWSRATLLLSPAVLMDRFPDLASMIGQPPQAVAEC